MVSHYRIFDDCSRIKLVPLQHGIENDCFLFPYCADMLGRNHNRGQEVKPYLCLFCQISPVYGLLLSSSLTPFHFTVCQLSYNLLTVGVVYYLLVFGSMLLPFHSVHFTEDFRSIRNPNSSDINRVILPPHQVRVEFSNYCCVSRLLMLAEVSPTSLFY